MPATDTDPAFCVSPLRQPSLSRCLQQIFRKIPNHQDALTQQWVGDRDQQMQLCTVSLTEKKAVFLRISQHRQTTDWQQLVLIQNHRHHCSAFSGTPMFISGNPSTRVVWRVVWRKLSRSCMDAPGYQLMLVGKQSVLRSTILS